MFTAFLFGWVFSSILYFEVAIQRAKDSVAAIYKSRQMTPDLTDEEKAKQDKQIVSIEFTIAGLEEDMAAYKEPETEEPPAKNPRLSVHSYESANRSKWPPV